MGYISRIGGAVHEKYGKCYTYTVWMMKILMKDPMTNCLKMEMGCRKNKQKLDGHGKSLNIEKTLGKSTVPETFPTWKDNVR